MSTHLDGVSHRFRDLGEIFNGVTGDGTTSSNLGVQQGDSGAVELSESLGNSLVMSQNSVAEFSCNVSSKQFVLLYLILIL